MYFGINKIVSKELKDMKLIYKIIVASIKNDDTVISKRNALTGQDGADSLYGKITSKGIVYYNHVLCNGKQRSKQQYQ